MPAAETVSPNAETRGAAALGPTLMMAVAGAGALAEVASEGAIPVGAGVVPVDVGWGDGEAVGGVPDGVRMSEVAGVGAEKMLDVDVAVAVPVVEPLAVDAPM